MNPKLVALLIGFLLIGLLWGLIIVRSRKRPQLLGECFVLFFGTFGLACFGLGLKRFFTRGIDYRFLAVALLGIGLFGLCLVLKRQLQSR